jgi:hypothetical protein
MPINDLEKCWVSYLTLFKRVCCVKAKLINEIYELALDSKTGKATVASQLEVTITQPNDM